MASVVVAHSDSHPVRVDLFRKHLPGFDVYEVDLPSGTLVDGEEELRAVLEERDPEALYLRPGDVTRSVIDHAPNLEVIAVNGSGYDHVDIEAATDRGVVITHSPEAPAPSVAEHALSLLFALIRNLPKTFDLTADGEWGDARNLSRSDVSEYTIGVIGLGSIGFEFAGHVRTFDAPVIAHDPYVRGERTSPIYPRYNRDTIEEAGIELTDKADVFERADVVSLHVPLNEQTRGMVSTRELERLSGGYLINTARGNIVDESALIDAVEADKLAGVGLDVMETEPPDPDNPLLAAESVHVTPHIAGATERCMERAAVLAAEKISAVVDGEGSGSVVNPEAQEA